MNPLEVNGLIERARALIVAAIPEAEHGRFLEDFAPLFQQIRESGRAYGQ